MHGFVVTRFVTILVLLVLLIGIASCDMHTDGAKKIRSAEMRMALV